MISTHPLRRPMMMGRTSKPTNQLARIAGRRSYTAGAGGPEFAGLTPGVDSLVIEAFDPGSAAPGFIVRFEITPTSVSADQIIADMLATAGTVGTDPARTLDDVCTVGLEGNAIFIRQKNPNQEITGTPYLAYIHIRDTSAVVGTPPNAAAALGFPVEDDPFAYVVGGDLFFTQPGRADGDLVNPQGTTFYEFGEDWNAYTFNRAMYGVARELDRQDTRDRRDVAFPLEIDVDLPAVALTYQWPPGSSAWTVVRDGNDDIVSLQLPVSFGTDRFFWYVAPDLDKASTPVELSRYFSLLDQFNEEIISATQRCSVNHVTRGQVVGASWNTDTDGSLGGTFGWSDNAGSNLLGVTTEKEIIAATTTVQGDIQDVLYKSAIRVYESGNPIDLTNVIRPGDIAVIAGHDLHAPFNNDGRYVVESLATDPLDNVSSIVFLRSLDPSDRGGLNDKNSITFGTVTFEASGEFADGVWVSFDPPIPSRYDGIRLRAGLRGAAAWSPIDAGADSLDHIRTASDADLSLQAVIMAMKGPMVEATDDWLQDPYVAGTEPADSSGPPFTWGTPGDPDLDLEDIGRRIDLEGAYDGMGREDGGGAQVVTSSQPIEIYPAKRIAELGGGYLWRKDNALSAALPVQFTRYLRYIRVLSGPDVFSVQDVGKLARFVDSVMGFVHTVRVTDYISPTQARLALDSTLMGTVPETTVWGGDLYLMSADDIYRDGMGIHFENTLPDGSVPAASTVRDRIISDPNEFMGDTHDAAADFFPGTMDPGGTLTLPGASALAYFTEYLHWPGYEGLVCTPVHLDFIPGVTHTFDGAGRYAVEEIVSVVTTPGFEEVVLRLCEVSLPGRGPISASTAPSDGWATILQPEGYHHCLYNSGVNNWMAGIYSRGRYDSATELQHGFVGESVGNGVGFHGRALVPKDNIVYTDSPPSAAAARQPFWGLSWAPAEGSALFQHFGYIREAGATVPASQVNVGVATRGEFIGQSDDATGAAGFYRTQNLDTYGALGYGDLGLGAWASQFIVFGQGPEDMSGDGGTTQDAKGAAFAAGVRDTNLDLWPWSAKFLNGLVMTKGAYPALDFWESGGGIAADEHLWRFSADSSIFYFTALNDAYLTAPFPSVFQSFGRTGPVADYIRAHTLLQIRNNTPTLEFYDEDSVADRRRWRWETSGDDLKLIAYTDALGVPRTYVTFSRDGAGGPTYQNQVEFAGYDSAILGAAWVRVGEDRDTTDLLLYGRIQNDLLTETGAPAKVGEYDAAATRPGRWAEVATDLYRHQVKLTSTSPSSTLDGGITGYINIDAHSAAGNCRDASIPSDGTQGWLYDNSGGPRGFLHARHFGTPETVTLFYPLDPMHGLWFHEARFYGRASTNGGAGTNPFIEVQLCRRPVDGSTALEGIDEEIIAELTITDQALAWYPLEDGSTYVPFNHQVNRDGYAYYIRVSAKSYDALNIIQFYGISIETRYDTGYWH